MKTYNRRCKNRLSLTLSIDLWLLVFSIYFLASCTIVEYFRAEKAPYDEELSNNYNQTILNKSSSADVLAVIHRPEYELLSQSKNAIASVGQKKKGHEIWFNMVAFDENELTAKRKYFFLVDEKVKSLLGIRPKRRLTFDCEMVLDEKTLDQPYANENARRIAILKQLLENVRKDVDELAEDNKTLDICGMLINQTLETALRKLEQSPVLASKLSDAGGVDIDHITLGKGGIEMSTTYNIVKAKVRLGPDVWAIEDPFAIEE